MDMGDAIKIEKELEKYHTEIILVMHGIATVGVKSRMWRVLLINKFKEYDIQYREDKRGLCFNVMANDLCKLLKKGCEG